MGRHRGAWIRYGEHLNPEQVAFAADHYAVAILQPWESSAAREMKAAQPDMTLLCYKCLSSARSYEPGPVFTSGVCHDEAEESGEHWFGHHSPLRQALGSLVDDAGTSLKGVGKILVPNVAESRREPPGARTVGPAHHLWRWSGGDVAGVRGPDLLRPCDGGLPDAGAARTGALHHAGADRRHASRRGRPAPHLRRPTEQLWWVGNGARGYGDPAPGDQSGAPPAHLAATSGVVRVVPAGVDRLGRARTTVRDRRLAFAS